MNAGEGRCEAVGRPRGPALPLPCSRARASAALVFVALLVLRVPPAAASTLPTSAARPQLRERFCIAGRVLKQDRTPFRSTIPAVLLSSVGTPLTRQVQVDPKGRFEFKDLSAGSYCLVAGLSTGARQRRTVELVAAAADSRGRIYVEFLLDERLKPDHTVSADELSVPAGAWAAHKKSRVLLERSDIAAAAAALREAVEIAPHFSAAWNDLGAIALRERRLEEAEACFRTALEHEPESYPALVNLGGALLSLRRWEESIRVNLVAAERNPGDPLPQAQLGMCYYYRNSFEDAVRHLRRAKVLDPAHYSYPQLTLIEIFSRKGDFRAVEAEIREFLGHHPDSKHAPALRARLKAISDRSSR